MEGKIIQDLSDVYVTLEDIEFKGRYAVPVALCLQKIESVIAQLNLIKKEDDQHE